MALVLLSVITCAQTQPPYLTNLTDARFKGVTEDWTSPALTSSHLIPALPLIGFVEEHPSYSVSLIRVQWRRGDPIDLWVIKPTGVKKPPVIMYLYGYPSDTEIFKNPKFQEFTTRGGFAAIGFVTALTGHRYHDIPWKNWFVSELQQCLAVSAHDVQMVLDYLASRGDLDMDRVGVYGQLSGASIAILASAADPRIKVMDSLDPWGDWPSWMKESPFVPASERADYVKPEFLNKVAFLEPINWMPKIQARKFRLQQRSFEDETPVASKKKLQAAVAPGAVVAFYKNRDEFANAQGENAEKSLDWIKDELRKLPKSEPASTLAVQKSLWHRGGLIDLGTVGGDTGNAESLNDADEVVGEADLPGVSGSQLHHAFFWQHGVLTDLGTQDGDRCSVAQSINSRGQVVGASTDCASLLNGHAFLWEQGGSMVDLNSFVPPGSDLTLTFATLISDQGEIAAQGVLSNGDAHAILLIPCDEEQGDNEGCEDESAGAGVVRHAPPSRGTTSRTPDWQRGRMFHLRHTAAGPAN